MAEDIALLVPVAVQQSPGTLCERRVSCNLRHKCGRPASACLAACQLLSAAEPGGLRRKWHKEKRSAATAAVLGRTLRCIMCAFC